MDIYLLLIIILIFLGSNIFVKKFNKDYLSKENTSCIKGIFILIVFFQHATNYIKISQKKNYFILLISKWLGQFVVTLFLFYSGYGIYESIKRKKQKYIKTIPKNRIFKTWFHFAIAILLFIILNTFLQIKYSLYQNLFAFIGWTGIGNSNWYIFGILAMYIITYISFSIFDKNDKSAIKLVWFLSMIFLLFMNRYRDYYWYNTLLCYPLGMTFSYNMNTIEKIIFYNKKYIMILLLSLFSVFTLKKFIYFNFYYYEIAACAFALLIIIITMKIKINNKILKWFGDNLFWVYILQRIPMIYLHHIGYSIHPYRFFLASFVITLILVVLVKSIVEKIDKKVFIEKKHS